METTTPGQDAPIATDAPVIFRSKKRRPNLRSRQGDGTPQAAPSTSPTDAPDSGHDRRDAGEDEEEDVSVAQLLRQRRRQMKAKGIEFRVEKPAGEDDDAMDPERSLVLAEQGPAPGDEVLGGIPTRFAPQTGLGVELVNRHMVEYVESKLANRHAPGTTPDAEQQQGQHTSQGHGPATGTTPAGSLEAQKPTIQGKLMEVDLGDEVRSRNVALTERAKRRLEGEAAADNDGGSDSAGASRKVRVGRDGKPIRGRNRRNSDDIKRDQLVEQLLRENRPDLSLIPGEQPIAAPAYGDDDDGAADDRIAEEFKREFLDAVAQRRQRRRAAKPTRPNERKNDPDVLKGPKLGGSRNMRSTVRNILLQQEKDKAARR